MKRILCAALCLALLLSGCAAAPAASENEGLQIVATVFPAYDWALQVLGGADGASVTLLLDKGVDMHSFQPSAQDVVRIRSCDLLIYVGGESEAWITELLQQAGEAAPRSLNLMEALRDTLKEEELVEGMQGEAEDGVYDEHIWLSLRNAQTAVDRIAEALGELDAPNREGYAARAEAYRQELAALDADYAAAVAAARVDTLLFADRFPFRYLVEDYGLRYYAAFPGCEAETEASFETVLFLANKLDELGLGAVLTIDGSDRRVAETVVRASSAQSAGILTLDSMQSASSQDLAAGRDYLAVMRDNLAVLTEALG